MNILLTSTGNLQDREHERLIEALRARRHIVETLAFERLIDYVKFDKSSLGVCRRGCVQSGHGPGWNYLLPIETCSEPRR